MEWTSRSARSRLIGALIATLLGAWAFDLVRRLGIEDPYVAFLCAVAVAGIVVIPMVQARAEKDRFTAENDARQTLVQLVVGLLLLAGTFVAGKQFLNQVETNQRNWEATQETLRLTREANLSDRLTDAIDQLAADEVSARVGGVYNLERVSRELTDQRPVLDTLSALVRSRTPRPRGAGDTPPPAYNRDPIDVDPREEVRPPPDVQAALNVISRNSWATFESPRRLYPGRNQSPDRFSVPISIDLADAELSGVDLSDFRVRPAKSQPNTPNMTLIDHVRLDRTRLDRALLGNASLAGASLAGARLRGAWMRHVVLRGANLEAADFSRANLQSAWLQRANADGSRFVDAYASDVDARDANFSGANFTGADLDSADFQGANLEHANFSGANLTAAIFRSARLANASFVGAILQRADFSGVSLDRTRGISAEQLRSAITDASTRMPQALYPKK